MNVLPVVINLDRRWDRYQRFCEVFPLPHVRFSAQDGTGSLTTAWDRTLINLIRYYPKNPRAMLHGIYGCWQSHYRVWEKLANDWNHSAYLIMEDDITVGADFPELFERVSNNISQDFDLYFLGGAISENYVPDDLDSEWEVGMSNDMSVHVLRNPSPVCNYNSAGRGLYGYVLTQWGARKLLDLVGVTAACRTSFPAVDEWLNHQRGTVSACDVFPHRIWVENTGAAATRQDDSDIDPRAQAKKAIIPVRTNHNE